MRAEETAVAGAKIIHPDPFRDERGWFARLWCAEETASLGVDPSLAQISQSHNDRAGTLRGLHFQRAPHEEGKLIRAVRGALYDVLVDLRAESPSFGRWVGVELSADNGLALYAPPGLAHGFLTLADDTTALYLISTPYAPGFGDGLRWDDPELAIDWPRAPATMSEKDRALSGFREAAARRADAVAAAAGPDGPAG